MIRNIRRGVPATNELAQVSTVFGKWDGLKPSLVFLAGRGVSWVGK